MVENNVVFMHLLKKDLCLECREKRLKNKTSKRNLLGADCSFLKLTKCFECREIKECLPYFFLYTELFAFEKPLKKNSMEVDCYESL
jgi:hypothetical protein